MDVYGCICMCIMCSVCSMLIKPYSPICTGVFHFNGGGKLHHLHLEGSMPYKTHTYYSQQHLQNLMDKQIQVVINPSSRVYTLHTLYYTYVHMHIHIHIHLLRIHIHIPLTHTNIHIHIYRWYATRLSPRSERTCPCLSTHSARTMSDEKLGYWVGRLRDTRSCVYVWWVYVCVCFYFIHYIAMMYM